MGMGSSLKRVSHSAMVLFLSCFAFAQSGESSPEWGSDEPFNQYYLIHDPFSSFRPRFEDPQNLLHAPSFVKAVANLLNFDFYNRPLPAPQEPYNRRGHFGDWVNDPRDNNCYNTRAKVLIRDSTKPVVFRSNPCVVDGGEWLEPYVGKTARLAKEVQIDHLVALKNAYVSGASKWDWPSRCLYANYLGNSFHLVTADARENMRKGARTPADWMPPNRGVTCAYLNNWLRTKMIWGLALNVREAQAIQGIVRQAGCEPERFMMDERDLKAQRQTIAANLDLCSRMKPRP
ncbi:MAG: HNH endonuclease [Bdellovibrionaceae bacterium]|nr:HNH endonuclease [Pseudobdellovibrionaceae bacterium]